MSAGERAQQSESAGAALRRLRQRTGLSANHVADVLSWSRSKLSRIETSSSGIKVPDLERLFEVYRATGEEQAEVEALLDPERRARGGSVALPATYKRYVELEAEASQISTYGAVVVPGLLQTQEYAAAMIQATPTPEDEFVPERLTTRLVRQAVLAQAVTLTVVLDEAVTMRAIGGDAVMRRQMRRLLELGEQPHTTIRLLPFAVGAHPALSGPFAILDFPADMERAPQVYCDGLTGGVLRADPNDVARYRACFSTLTDLALDAQMSTEFFATIADGLRDK